MCSQCQVDYSSTLRSIKERNSTITRQLFTLEPLLDMLAKNEIAGSGAIKYEQPNPKRGEAEKELKVKGRGLSDVCEKQPTIGSCMLV